MSYDIYLTTLSGDALILPDDIDVRGGTYQMGGASEAWLNITYNYGSFYYDILGEKGIREIYGMTGAQAIPILEKCVATLGVERDSNYWAATRGNAGAALNDLLTMARALPDGIFQGD